MMPMAPVPPPLLKLHRVAPVVGLRQTSWLSDVVFRVPANRRFQGAPNLVKRPAGAAWTESPSRLAEAQSWAPVLAFTAYTQPSCEPRKATDGADVPTGSGMIGGRP